MEASPEYSPVTHPPPILYTSLRTCFQRTGGMGQGNKEGHVMGDTMVCSRTTSLSEEYTQHTSWQVLGPF